MIGKLFDLFNVFTGEQKVNFFIQNLNIVGNQCGSIIKHEIKLIFQINFNQNKNILECGISESIVFGWQTYISSYQLNSITSLLKNELNIVKNINFLTSIYLGKVHQIIINDDVN